MSTSTDAGATLVTGGGSDKNVTGTLVARSRGNLRAGRKAGTYCTYCGGAFECLNCGKGYRDCKCQVYQSGHTKCHLASKGGAQ
jgi:hypothetical protein